MALSKLLAVGRSVRSVTEQPARYRMKQQNLLPTFGETKAEARAVESVSPAAEAAPKPAPVTQATRNMAPETIAMTTRATGSDKAAAFVEATKKLRPFDDGSWFKNPFARTPAGKSDTAPVQTELSLDSVKPVRNDLSESDLELGRPPGRTALQPDAPSAPTQVPAAPPTPTGGLWKRIRTRLFGATEAN